MENSTLNRKKAKDVFDFESRLNNIIALSHDINLDPLFEKCALLAVSSKTLSPCQLQRNFGISFDRANLIINQLEHFGIVSSKTGFKPRLSLVNDRELACILEKLETANLLE